MTINGMKITAQSIAYDMCHRFYLLENKEKIKQAKEYKYHIFPITDLPRLWEKACPLKFIDIWEDDIEKMPITIVPQFYKPIKFSQL